MMKKLASGLGLLVFLFLGFVAYGFLAPLKIHHETTLVPASFDTPAPDVQDAPFVGLALSGGGARAAVFAAAGMEALAEKGLLDQVNHVSSVSGGGFTAAYWALNPMPEGDRAAYFEAMKATVGHDYQRDITVHQFMSPSRLLSPSRRLLSLQDALIGQAFLQNDEGKDATIADLPESRAFFFNAVSYDTGRRFVISNQPLPDPSDISKSRLPSDIRALSFSDQTTLRAAPADFPVSLAVATSAAFPPYVGPVSVQVNSAGDEATQYWHLGDGGLLENNGVETLREAIYARADLQGATIYAFNGGQRLDPDLTLADISVFSRDIVQLIDVILTYAEGHRNAGYVALDAGSGMSIEVFDFDYLALEDILTNADLRNAHPVLRDKTLQQEEVSRWQTWDSWADVVPLADRGESPTPFHRLRVIPTGYSITKGDAALISAAAVALVEQLTP